MARGAIVNLPRGSADRLSASVRRLRGQYASMGPELEKANQEAVNWLNRRALEVLDKSVRAHGRPQRPEGVLRNVFINDGASTKSARGFRWGVSQKLNASGAGPYWRAIESGSTVFVGRITRVIWIGKGGNFLPPLPSRYPSDARMINDWNGALNGRGWAATIKRPIIGYEFMSKAASEFESEDVYVKQLLPEASAQWRKVLRKAKRTGTSPKAVRG
jgi:hypothetical protein